MLVWDTAKGETITQLKGHSAEVNGVAYAADGQSLASASSDGIVQIWDTKEFRDLVTLQGHQGAVTPVAFDPAGGRLASAGADSLVKVWHTTRTLATASHCSQGTGCVLVGPRGVPPQLVPVALDKNGRLPFLIIETRMVPEKRTRMVLRDGKQVAEEYTVLKPVMEQKISPREVRDLRAFTADGRKLDEKTLRQRLAQPTSLLVFANGPFDPYYLRAYREDTVVLVTEQIQPAPPQGKPLVEVPSSALLCAAENGLVEVGTIEFTSITKTVFKEVAETVMDGDKPRTVTRQVPVTVCEALSILRRRRLPQTSLELYDAAGQQVDPAKLALRPSEPVTVLLVGEAEVKPLSPEQAALLKPGTLRLRMSGTGGMPASGNEA